MGKPSNFLRIALLLLPLHVRAMSCQPLDVATKPDETGFVQLDRGSGEIDRLYWAKLKAPKSPVKGTLFYLAGGPIAHYIYLDVAKNFQKDGYPNYDVVLYDYLGINCSGVIQDERTLKQKARFLTQPAMARDFIALKRQLVGNQKVLLMGGSHGSMLGAQIVGDFPNEIERAILFSGSPRTDWFRDGWFRFESLLARMATDSGDFGADLDRLLQIAESGKLAVPIEQQNVNVSRAALEISLWMNFSQSSAAQAKLPELVSSALKGDTAWIANAVLASVAVAAPVSPEPPPTLITDVIAFHRCNIWFPKSARGLPDGRPPKGRFLSYSSFFNYWDQICQSYDNLGEFPQNSIPAHPTTVPLLVWVGDQDYFDPVKNLADFSLLSSKLSFHLMPGWSHDFGQDSETGITKVSSMIETFVSNGCEAVLSETTPKKRSLVHSP